LDLAQPIFILASISKNNHRAVILLLEPRPHNTNHALVPGWIIQTESCRQTALSRHQQGILALFEHLECLLLHLGFNALALLVDGVQLESQRHGFIAVIRKQAGNSQRHIFQTAGSIQSWPHSKTKVSSHERRKRAFTHLQQSQDAWTGSALADATQTFVNQNAVVAIQRHQISNRTQRDQIQQISQTRLADTTEIKPVAIAQLCTQTEHQIKHHTHTGQRLAVEFTARLVGIEDGSGSGQPGARQMVIGDQYRDPGGIGSSNALKTGDTVIHSNNQVGFAFQCQFYNFRTQTITIGKTVRHDVVHITETHAAQGANGQHTAGGTIGIKVGNNQYSPLLLQHIAQQVYSLIHALHA